jgi:hypothetical protein
VITYRIRAFGGVFAVWVPPSVAVTPMDIWVQVERAGVLEYLSVYLQIDHMEPIEASYYGGSAPYFRYEAYALAILDIRQSDLLVDLNNIDPKTGNKYQYRVVSDPETFPDQHTEMVIDRMVGV